MGKIKKELPVASLDKRIGIQNNDFIKPFVETPAWGMVKDVTDQQAYDLSRFDGYANIGSVNQFLYENQNFGERTAKIGMRGLGTFGATVTEDLALIASLPVGIANIGTDKGFIGGLTDNPMVKAIEEVHKDMLEHLPLYYSDEDLKNPDLMNWVTSGKIFDDGMQGAAFLASSLVPAGLISKLTKSAVFTTKVLKAVAKGEKAIESGGKFLSKAGVISSLFEKRALKVLSTLDDGTKAALAAEGIDLVQLERTVANTQRLVDKLGQGTSAVIGRMAESAMETNQTYDELIEKGIDPKIARQQANNVFLGNMALSVLDYHQFKTILGSLSAAGKKGLASEVLEDAAKRVDLTDFLKGGKAVYNSASHKGLRTAWEISKGVASEGFEEFIQADMQEAAKKQADLFQNALTDSTFDNAPHSLVDNMLEYVRQLTSFGGQVISSIPETSRSLEAKEAAIIGGLLGGGGATLTRMGYNAKVDKAGNQMAENFNNSKVDNEALTDEKIYKLNPDYKKPEKEPATPEEIKADNEAKYIYDKKGNKVLNNEYVKNLNLFTTLEVYKKQALDKKDELSFKRLSELQLANHALLFAENGKLEDLLNRFDNLVDDGKVSEEVKADLAKKHNVDINTITPEFIQDLKTRVENYGRVINDVKADPTLSALSAKAQRVAAKRIVNYEINKKAINDLAKERNALEVKNIEFVSNLREGLTENAENESGFTGIKQGMEKLEGLNPSEAARLKSLRASNKFLTEENDKILKWFENIRKEENLRKFDEDTNFYFEDKKVEDGKKAKKDLEDKLVPENVKQFYSENTIKDNEGFESTDFELTDDDGVKRTFSFVEGDYTNLYENGDPKGNLMSVYTLLNEKHKVRRPVKSKIQKSETTTEQGTFGEYNAPIEDRVDFEDGVMLNNKFYKLNKTYAYQKRNLKINEKYNKQREARLLSLNALIDSLKRKVLEEKSSRSKFIEEKKKVLEAVNNQIESVKDGRSKKSKAYQALLQQREQLTEEILKLEIELENLKDYMPSIIERHKELVEEKTKLEEELAYVKANAKEKVFPATIKENLEAKIKKVSAERENIGTLQESLEDLILETEIDITNIKKVIDAIDTLLNKIILEAYEKHSELFHTIMQSYGVKNYEQLKDVLLDISKEGISKKDRLILRNTSIDYKTLNSLLDAISELEYDKYTQELFNLQDKLERLESVHRQFLADNKLNKALNVYRKRYQLALYELREFKRALEFMKAPTSVGFSTETSKDNPPIVFTADEELDSLHKSFFRKHSADYIIAGNNFSTGLDSEFWSEDPEKAKESHNPDESKRRFFRWVENEGFKLNSEDVELLVVDINHPVYGIGKPKSVYTDTKNDSNHNEEDLRFVVVNSENKTPIVYENGIVSGSLATEKTTWSNGADRYYYSEHSDSSKVENTVKKEREILKQSLKANRPVYLKVNFISRGMPLNSKTKNNVLGSVLSEPNQIKDADITISEGTVVLSDRTFSYPSGRVLITFKNNATPLITRKINSKESLTALQIIKRIAKNYKNSKNTNIEERQKEAVKDSNFYKVEGNYKPIQLDTALKNIVYLNSSVDNTFYLQYNEFGVSLVTPFETFSESEILSGDVDSKILKLLENKVLQIDKQHLKGTRKHNEVVWNAETQSFETVLWDSYKHYLLGVKSDGSTISEQPPLSTTVPLAVKPTNVLGTTNAETGRRYQNGYIAYKQPKGIQGNNTKTTQQVKKAPENPQTPPAQPTVFAGYTYKTKGIDNVSKEQLDPIAEDFVKLIKEAKGDIDLFKNEFHKVVKTSETLYEFYIDANTIFTIDFNNNVKETEPSNKTVEPEPKTNPFTPTSKPFDGNSFAGDAKDTEALERKLEDTEKLVDVTEQIKHVAEILGIPIEKVDGLIAEGVVGRVLNNGRVLVSQIAVDGTPYHEAWHYVSQFLLTDSEREAVYEDFKNRKGISENATLLQVEEALAEDFRVYALNKNNNAKKSLIEKLFDKIINFLNKLFNNKSEFEKVFDSILEKKYKGKKPKSLMSFKYLNNTIKNVVTVSDVRQFHSYFVNILSGYGSEIFFKLDSEISEDIYDEVKNVVTKLTDEENFLNKIDNIIFEHKKYMASLGVESEFEFEDSTLSEDEKSALEAGIRLGEIKPGDGGLWKESFFVSSKAGIAKAIKILLSGISVKNNELTGLKESVALDKLINKLHNKLANINSISKMFELLQNSNDPELLEVYSLFNGGNITSDSTLYDVKLITSFYNQFCKSKENYFKIIVNKDGTLGIDNSNLSNKRNEVLKKWVANQAELVKENSSLIYIKDGQVFGKPELFTRPLTSDQAYQNFLNDIGIDIDLEETLDNVRKNKADTKRAVKNSIQKIFEAAKKGTPLNVLLSLNNNPEKGNLTNLIVFEGTYGPENYELQHTTPNGEIAYDVTLNSFYTYLLNSFLEGDISQFSNDPYAQDSLILERVLEGRVPKRAVIEGLTSSNDAEGSDLNKSSYSDFLKSILTASLNNIYEILITGDKKTVRALQLDSPYFEVVGEDTLESIIENATNLLFKYYQSEKQTIEKRARIGQFYLKGEDKLSKPSSEENDIGIFSAIVPYNSNDYVAKQKIRDFIKEAIIENKNTFIEEGVMTEDSLTLDKYNNLTKSILGHNRKISTKEEINKIVAAFTINDMVNAIEQTKVFFGQPIYYKDFIDMFKRFSGAIATRKSLLNNQAINQWMDINSPRTDGKTRDGNIKTLVFDDLVGVNEELLALSKTNSKFSEYGKIPSTDALGFIMPDDYKDILFKSGDWTTQQEETWRNNLVNVDKNNSALPPLKLVLNGSVSKTELKPHYYKFAVLPLSESFFEAISENNEKGEKLYPELYKMYEQMIDNQVGIAVFNSGNKVGTPVKKSTSKPQPFITNSGEVAPIEKGFIQNISMEFLGVQVENKPKVSLDSQSRGTQEAAIVMSNIFLNGQPVTRNGEVLKTKSGKPLHEVCQEIINTENTLTENLITELETELGLSKDSKGNYVFSSKEGGASLENLLIKEAIRRSSPSNLIESIRHSFNVLRKENVGFLDLVPSKEKLHNILASIVENRVVNQKRHGMSAVQFPGILLNNGKARIKTDGTDVKYNANDLEFYEDKVSGVNYAEIWLPNYLKGIIGEGVIGEDVDPNLLILEGFRIPTEKQNSLDIFKVKGFLPETMGNVVIVPPALAAKVGSDFDFDKVNLYYPNFKTIYNEFNFESLKSFKDSDYFKTLEPETKEYIDSLSLEEVNQSIKNLNRFSVTTGFGELGNLKDSEFFKGLSKQEQFILEDFKNVLVKYNTYKNKLIDNNKEEKRRLLKEGRVSVEYIGDSYLKDEDVSMRIKALENKLIRLKADLLSSPDLRESHLEPNSTKDMQTIAKELQSIRETKKDVYGKPLVKPVPNYKFSFLLNFAKRAAIRAKFWLGKELVGVIALHNKNHILSQISGIGISFDPSETTIPRINFEGINPQTDSEGKKYYPLGNVYAYDEKGNMTEELISDTLGQELSTAVDAIKTPDTLDSLNMNLTTTNVAALLTRLGVPRKTVFAFLTQPIIVEYVKMLSNGNSISIPVYERQRKAKVLELLRAKYPFQEVNLNQSKLLEFNNNYQHQILNDFIYYNELARELSDFQKAHSFDTKGFKNMVSARNAVYDYEQFKNSVTIYNGSNYINTFLKGFLNAYKKHGNVLPSANDRTGYFKNLFILEANTRIPDLLYTYERFLRDTIKNNKNFEKTVGILNSDFLAYVLTTTPHKTVSGVDKPSYASEFDSLMKGENSVAKTIIRLAKELKESGVETTLNSFRLESNEVDNLKLASKKLSPWEADALTNELRTLPPQELSRFLRFVLIQSGFNQSDLSLTQYFPANLFVNTLKNILQYVAPLTERTMEDFWIKFNLNNVNNSDLVPLIRLGKRTRIAVHGDLKGKIPIKEDSYFSKHLMIKTLHKQEDNTYIYKYWIKQLLPDGVSYAFTEVEPISTGYRFKNWGVDVSKITKAKSINVTDTKQNLVNVEQFIGFWTREEVAKQIDKVFLFGDNTNDRLNTKYIPSSTQAVIRGLPNAIGIDTKKDRGTNEGIKVQSENISSRGSEFAKKLTNVGNNVGLIYKGKQYINSEHAYQTWKSGEFNQEGYSLKGGKVRGGKIGDTFNIMIDILTEKLKQNPDLIKGINERGGLDYISKSTHNVIGDSFWESTGQNKFIEALYQAAVNVGIKNNNSSYFSDADFPQFKKQVDEAIQKAKDSGKTIVIPADGIGTGKAMLKEKAPKLFNYLEQELNKLKFNSKSKLDISKNTSKKFTPQQQSLVSKVVKDAEEYYKTKLSRQQQMVLKYNTELNNGKGLQNLQQFSMFAKETTEGFLSKKPNATESEIKNLIFETLKKCFTT